MCYRAGLNGGIMTVVRRIAIFNILSIVSLISACGGSDSKNSTDPPAASSGSSTSSSGSSTSSSGSSTSSSTSSSGATSSTTDVLTYHNDTMRTGQNLTETTLTPSNVNSSTFGLLRILTADAPVDATPLIASKVSIGGVTHNVVYVASEHDSVYAYDADSGAALAQVSLLGSGETPSDTHSCSQVQPEIGITATPVIDRSVGPNGTLYVVAMSKDSSGTYYQRLHALDLVTLADRVPAVVIQATSPGSGPNSTNGILTFQAGQYKERGALLAANGQIDTVGASHCDDMPYNGWIIAYNESTMAQTAVLNYTPSGTQGAIWNGAGLAGG